MRSSPGNSLFPSISQRVSKVGASSVMRMWRAPANCPLISANESFAHTISPVVAKATTVGSGDFVTARRTSPPSIWMFSINPRTRCFRSLSLRRATTRRITQTAMPISPYGMEKYIPHAANSRNAA